jgi:hypothetical protein
MTSTRNDEFALARGRRPLRWAAVAVAGLTLAGVFPGLAGGQEGNDFVAGSGYASAQILRVGPTASRLSLAPTFGLSLADYLSTVGRGQTTVADWAAIGVAEASLPENTPLVKVESTGDKTKVGEFASCEEGELSSHCLVAGGTDGSGNGGGLMELHAIAAKVPSGESTFTWGSFEIAGLIKMGKGKAHTTSGIVKDGLRQSVSTVDISSLVLGSGLNSASLSGLHWEATQRSGTDGKAVTGSFTIQGASAGGVPMNIPAGGAELESVLGPLNTALAPTGFAIRPPAVETTGDVARVTPLAFEIVNSPLGRQFLAPILEAAQPVREPLSDAFIDLAKALYEGSDKEAPDLTVAVLAADLALGIASGSSQLHVEFGGANAYTEGERYASPFSGDFEVPRTDNGGPQTVFAPGTKGTPGKPGTVKDTGELVSALPQSPSQKTIPGTKGGAAMLVGLLGLAVAGALAGADWYRMRVAKRTLAEG